MPVSTDPSYRGRPICTGLTSISGAPQVVSASGTIPMVVHASLFDLVANGGEGETPYDSEIYEDVEARWDFDDPDSTETLPDPFGGGTILTNSEQVRPEAVHVYRVPGTYTVTCTMRAWNGTEFVAHTTTTLVRVATVQIQVLNATTGTYTVKVQNNAHARAARLESTRNHFLARAAGHSIVPGASGFFVSAHFRRRSVTAQTRNIAAYYANANGKRSWAIYGTTTGAIALKVGDATSGIVTATTTTLYADTAWHHVIGWVDTATGDVKVWVDGVQDGSASRTAGLAMRAPSDVPFAIGAEFDASLARLNVSTIDVDEVWVGNRPPTSDEITWLHNSGVGRHHADFATGSPPAGLDSALVAAWSLDEKRGPTFADSTGNGHTLNDYILTNQFPGVNGCTARVYRAGGTETGAIAWNANLQGQIDAIVAATDLTVDECGAERFEVLRFGGPRAGEAWTLAPGTTASGFDGTVTTLGLNDAEIASGVAVAAWDEARTPTVYYDSNAAGGGNGTEATPYNLAATLVSLLGSQLGRAYRHRIKAGSDFTVAAEIGSFPKTLTVVEKYGTGANPILRHPTTNVLKVSVNPEFCLGGLVLDGIDLIGKSMVIDTNIAESTTYISPHSAGLHLIDCDLSSSYAELTRANIGSQSTEGVAVIRGSVSGGGGTSPGYAGATVDRAQSIASAGAAFVAFVGTEISGGGCNIGSGGNTYAHGIYHGIFGHACGFLNLEFGPTAANPAYATPGDPTNLEMNFCIKGASGGATGDIALRTRGMTIDSCHLTGTQNAGAIGRVNGDLPAGNRSSPVLISRNEFHRSTEPGGSQDKGYYIADGDSATFRDNINYKNSGMAIELNSGGLPCNAKFYRNRFAIASGKEVYNAGINIQAGNLASLEITDNIFQLFGVNIGDGEGTGSGRRGVIAMDWSEAAGLGATIDRNQYYTPDQANGNVFVDLDNLAVQGLAAWQGNGWDPTVSLEDPEWPDPLDGDFGDTGDPEPEAEVEFEIRVGGQVLSLRWSTA